MREFMSDDTHWDCRTCGKDGIGEMQLREHAQEHAELEAVAFASMYVRGNDFPLQISIRAARGDGEKE